MLRTYSDARSRASRQTRLHQSRDGAPAVLLAGPCHQEMIAPRPVDVEVAPQQPLLAETAPVQHHAAGGVLRANVDLDAVQADAARGTVVVADSGRIRKIDVPFPLSEDGVKTIPSADASELYEFDAGGRHVRTRSGSTGTTIRTFEYDAQGRVSKIEEADGRALTSSRVNGEQPASTW